MVLVRLEFSPAVCALVVLSVFFLRLERTLLIQRIFRLCALADNIPVAAH